MSNSFQELSCNDVLTPEQDGGTTPGPAEAATFGSLEFIPQPPQGNAHSSDTTPGLAEDDFSDVTSCIPQPPHGGVPVRPSSVPSCSGTTPGLAATPPLESQPPPGVPLFVPAILRQVPAVLPIYALVMNAAKN